MIRYDIIWYDLIWYDEIWYVSWPPISSPFVFITLLFSFFLSSLDLLRSSSRSMFITHWSSSFISSHSCLSLPSSPQQFLFLQLILLPLPRQSFFYFFFFFFTIIFCFFSFFFFFFFFYFFYFFLIFFFFSFFFSFFSFFLVIFFLKEEVIHFYLNGNRHLRLLPLLLFISSVYSPTLSLTHSP